MFGLHSLVTHCKEGLYNIFYSFRYSLHCVKYLNSYNSGFNCSLDQHLLWWKVAFFDKIEVIWQEYLGYLLFPAAAAEMESCLGMLFLSVCIISF